MKTENSKALVAGIGAAISGRLGSLLLALLGVVLAAGGLQAGTITGQVKGPNKGAITTNQDPVPGATVTLTRGSLTSVDQIPTDLGAFASGTVSYLNFSNSTGNMFSTLSAVAPADNVAGVFTSSFEVYYGGSYTFRLTSDDGSKLYVNDQLVVNNDGIHAPATATGAINLLGQENGAGRGFHTIRVEFFEASGGGNLVVQWQKTTGARLFGNRDFGGNVLFNGDGGTLGNYIAYNWNYNLYTVPTTPLSTTTDSLGNYSFPDVSLRQPVTLTPTYPEGSFNVASSPNLIGAGPHNFTLTSSPPIIAPIANQTMPEDGSLAIPVTASDYQGNALVTATASDTTLFPAGSVGLIAGNLYLIPAPNLSGTATITLTATDYEVPAKVSTRQFTVTVSPVNDAPVAGVASSIRLAASQYIDIPTYSTAAPTNEITIEFWAKVDPNTGSAVLGLTDDVGNRLRIGLAEGASSLVRGTVGWDFGNINTGGRLSYTPSVAYTNSWQHFAFVASQGGNYMRIYRNGVLEASKVGMVPFKAANKSLRLGSNIGMSLADFRVWNVARTDAQIAASRHGTLPPVTPGLVVHYRFNERSGTRLKDLADGSTTPVQFGSQDGNISANNLLIPQDATLAASLVTPVVENAPTLVYLPANDLETPNLTYTASTLVGGGTTLTAAPGASASSGLFVYTPAPGYSGVDTISYTLSDGVLTSTGTVSLQVNAVNDPPVVGPGTSISLNGAGQFLDAPDGIWFGSTFTVEGWVFVRSYANWSRLFDFGNGQGLDHVVGSLTVAGTGTPALFVGPGIVGPVITSSTVLPLNTWAHLAFTRDAAGVGHIYINGVETASGPINAPTNVVRTQNFFGKSNWAGDAFANARFSELRVWSVARSAAEIIRGWHAALPGSTAGLLAQYHLNEGFGASATDSSVVNGAQNLTLVGSPAWRLVDGPGHALSLDGTTQNGLASDSAALSLTGPMTVEAWVRPTSTSVDQAIVSKMDASNTGYELMLLNGGKLRVSMSASTANLRSLDSSSTLAPNVWTHVAFVSDGVRVLMYINGVLDTQSLVPIHPADGASALYIGAKGNSGVAGTRFNGRIADVRIWKAARTPLQIAQWLGGVSAASSDLVANYLLDPSAPTADAAVADGRQDISLIGSPVVAEETVLLPKLQAVRFTEDTALVLVPPALDMEGAALTYTSVTPSSGTVSTVVGGQLTYTPALNFNGAATITYVVTDGTTPRTGTLYLQGTPVEDGPTLAVIPNQTVSEGGATATINISLTDGDPDLTQALTVTATSGNTALIRNPVVSYQSPAETASLSFKPRPGQSGSSTITVLVTDVASGLSTSRQFTVTVAPVDDPPNVGPGTSLAFNGSNSVQVAGFGAVLPTDEVTIEFWVKFPGNALGRAFQLNGVYADLNSFGAVNWVFGSGTGDANGRVAYVPPTSIVGTWQHFALVASRSGNYMKVFRNGVEEASKPGMIPFVRGNFPLTLGQSLGANGELADFRVWSVARTSEQVKGSLHSALANDTQGLVAYYRFNGKPTLVLKDFASAVGQAGAQDGALVPDAQDNDPIWKTSASAAAPQGGDPQLTSRQVVLVADGSTTNVFLPAWDAESGLGVTWQNVTVTAGSITGIGTSGATTGVFVYTAPVGYNGPVTVNYSVKDPGLVNAAVAGSLNLRVYSAQNAAPTIASIPNVATQQDTALVEVPVTVTDDQSPSDLVVSTVILSNASLIQSASVTPGGSYRSLNIVPKPGEIGVVRIRVLVEDGGQKSAQVEFDLRIEPAPLFKVFDLGVLPGKAASYGTGINDQGAVVGYATETEDLASNPVGYYFNGIVNGGVVDGNPISRIESAPLASPFLALDINNSYDIVGFGKSGGNTLAWQRDLEQGLSLLGSTGLAATGTSAEARAINTNGVVAGVAVTSSGRRAFRVAPGETLLTDLGTAAVPRFNAASEANALNDAGAIVGSLFDSSGNRRAMVHESGKMQALFDAVDDTNSVAHGINAFGQVVGRSSAFAAGDQALSFDGVNDTVTVPNLLVNANGSTLAAGNAPFSVEAWMRVGAWPTSVSQPLRLGNLANFNSHYWKLTGSGDSGTLYLGLEGVGGSAVASGPVLLGAWNHFATTYTPTFGQSGTLVTYLNGRPVRTNELQFVNFQGLPLVLGSVPFNGTEYFSGDLDEVRVWRTTRSATEIASTYLTRLAGTETGLVCYLPFDEGSGNVSTLGLATGALSGTLVGNPAWTVRGGLPAPGLTVADAALQLDGNSSYAVLSTLPLGSASFTMEFRARRAKLGTLQTVLSQGTNQTAKGLQVGFQADNRFRLQFWNGTTLASTDPDTDLGWHHWAVTMNVTNGVRTLLRDGVVVGTDTIVIPYTGSGPVILGNSFFDTSGYSGAIDDVRIWSIARTPAEILADRNTRLSGSTSGLLTFHTFDEGGGASALNRVPTGSIASLQGGIYWSAADHGDSRAFLYETRSGRMSSLGLLPGTVFSEARAINDFGQIVGSAGSGTGGEAFFYTAGRMHAIKDLLPEVDELDQWKLETANGINRSGAIVGTGKHRGLTRSFLAMPATAIGQVVARPEGAVARYPSITILKQNRPDDSALNAFYWSEPEGKLYAIRPVVARIEWFTSMTDVSGIITNPDGTTSVAVNNQRVTMIAVNVWPKNPTIHIAGSPVDLQPAVTGANYSFIDVQYQENNPKVEPSSKVFTCTETGYSVLYYLKSSGAAPNPQAHAPYFEVVRTVPYNDSLAALGRLSALIGFEVTWPGHQEHGGKNGYVLFPMAAIDASGSDAAYNRGSRQGSILPVNQEKPGNLAHLNPDPLVVVWYRTNRVGVAWASVPVQYSLNWPAPGAVDKIVIASQLGSGELSSARYPGKQIYNQPDPSLPGYNPNEEHAYMPENVLFAIRNDLNYQQHSSPYTLLKYKNPTNGLWAIKVYQVVAEQAPYFFRYGGTVGKEIQPPLPLSLMPLCSESYPFPIESDVAWSDYKGKVYARMAGPEGSRTNLVVRWYYPMQPGFYHPEGKGVGECLAFLDRRTRGALQTPNNGVGVANTPIDVTYDIRWDDTPVLQVGQTLIHSMRGLPDVYNFANSQVIFDSLAAEKQGPRQLIRDIESRTGTAVNPVTAESTSLAMARFYDPISPRTLKTDVELPVGLKRQNIAGKEYLTDLPWMLKIRLSYDPINRWLSFAGHLDENFGVGDPLLLPNVLSQRERDRIKALAPGDSKWSALVDRLYHLTRNPNEVDLDPLDGIPDQALRLGLKNVLQTNFVAIAYEHYETVTTTSTYWQEGYSWSIIDFNGQDSEWVTVTTSSDQWVAKTSEIPTSLAEAVALDRTWRNTLLLDGGTSYRVPTGQTALNSSYTVTATVVGEILQSGPKVLTTGLGGVEPAVARPGQALAFDGSDDWVLVQPNNGFNLDLIGAPFTIEFWAQFNAATTEQYVVGQAGGPASLGQLRIGVRDGGKFAFDLGTTPASDSVFTTDTVFTDTAWHHWACVFDPETKVQSILRDGAVVASRTNAALTYVGAGPLELGRFGSAYFGGKLDEIRVWKTARTAAEIRSRMNKRLLGASDYAPTGAWPGTEQKLEILFRCDEGSGNLVNGAALTANGFQGQLNGGMARIVSDAPTGIPPRYLTIAENNDAALGGLPVTLHVIRVDDGPYQGDLKVLPGDNVFDERLTLRHSSDFGGDPDPLTFQWFIKPIGADFDPTDLPVVTDPNAEFPSDMRGWTLYTGFQPTSGSGVNYVTIGEGGESGLVTLSDNAFVGRYKGYAVNLNSAFAWSGWIGDPTGTPEQPRAALGEGWVKRVIRGLNPFDARTTDFHSSPAVTFASMLIQLGQRYEGPIAFNPSADAINKVGLIEAYTTVLERAKGLSINGVPQVDFNPANNALLLAATKLSDFNMVLGNEAYADASDPTIGFGSGSTEYGSLASSIFSFQNQLDSPLEEELTLLRGRDDSAAGVGARPVYNRLFWNFTLGEGEVAYQQNYNVSDQDSNGFIDEKDARILYPQGHGDAWGHYLSAAKQHYELLRHPFFTWIPRTELVSVAGAAIKVDFLDERKFAKVAAAKAKAGAEIVNLTYRMNYVDDPSGQWQGYKDSKPDRAWGVTEWARRAGMATYFDWVTGNTLLPSTDPNPAHVGIDKVDRQTVGELGELPSLHDQIQSQLDQADGGLNPLGLAKGVVPFDIDPTLVSSQSGVSSKTHFEQIQDRALKAMKNAQFVFDEVNKSTQALRRTQDTVEELTVNSINQERDYKNRLIEIFGYPYAGDIGAGKTYPGGYDGPDIYHWMYVPVSEYSGVANGDPGPTLSGIFTQINLGITASGDTTSGALGSANASFFFPEDFGTQTPSTSGDLFKEVFYPTLAQYRDSYYFAAPSSYGTRRAPGEIQMAISELIQAEARVKVAREGLDALVFDIEQKADLMSARYAFRAKELSIGYTLASEKGTILAVILTSKGLSKAAGISGLLARDIGAAVAEALPKSVGLSSDVTSVARGAIQGSAVAAGGTLQTIAKVSQLVAEAAERIGLPVAEAMAAAGVRAAGFEFEVKRDVAELETVIKRVPGATSELLRLMEQVNQAHGRYLASLAKGQRLLDERVAYRKRIASQTTENRYQDMTFRIFQNDALQKYRASFDVAQRYVFLAATAYDYESNLLGTDSRSGRNFLTDIIRQRSLGQMLNGSPVVGRGGLSDPMARMGGNFDVLKPQMGFNNPQTEANRFSVRSELFRLTDDSGAAWKTQLRSRKVANLWDIPEFRRYCRSFAPESAGAQPGLVIRFPSTVTAGRNFFDWPLGGGDSSYDASRFATKIRGVGVWFGNYNGRGLSQTPRIYLVPAGADVLASPTANDFSTREWRVVDQVVPVPFAIGASQLKSPSWIPLNDSLGGNFADVRRFASFRAYHDSGTAEPSQMTSDSRLIGRSVWNTEWVLIIPGQTLLANPNAGLDKFIDEISDIKLLFQTYSYSGN
jgi:uncharacterized membrane protein